MRTPRLKHGRAVLLLLSLVALPRAASAQMSVPAGETQATTVRATRERTLVWGRNPSRVIAVLPEGVLLDALSRDAQWIVVRLPEKYAGTGGAIGYVFEGHVSMVSGPPLPARAPASRITADRASVQTQARASRFGVRGYGTGAYTWFAAKDSFNAVLEQSGGVFYGGGGQVVIGPLFVDVGVERFAASGQRAFVLDGEVFRLGIPDRVTMTPVTVVAGYRFRERDRMIPYVGGGIGSLKFEETSDFADAGENVSERFTSYHAVGGVEYGLRRWVWLAGEFRYTAVPDALGAPGISADFEEDDLGGLSVAFKVMVGI